MLERKNTVHEDIIAELNSALYCKKLPLERSGAVADAYVVFPPLLFFRMSLVLFVGLFDLMFMFRSSDTVILISWRTTGATMTCLTFWDHRPLQSIVLSLLCLSHRRQVLLLPRGPLQR